jgi:hypothetical protein
MLFAWPGRVVSHVGELAVVQVPGGLVTVRDPHELLQDGVDVQVQASDPAHALRGVVFGDTYTVRQHGQVALLHSQGGASLALLLRPRETLPATFTLSIPAEPVELHEGAEPGPDLGNPKPFGGRACPRCPDLDPTAVYVAMSFGHHL